MLRASTALPPARPCAAAADRFALLRAADDLGGQVYVELDHCRRVLVSPLEGAPTLAQADPVLLGHLDR